MFVEAVRWEEPAGGRQHQLRNALPLRLPARAGQELQPQVRYAEMLIRVRCGVNMTESLTQSVIEISVGFCPITTVSIQ